MRARKFTLIKRGTVLAAATDSDPTFIAKAGNKAGLGFLNTRCKARQTVEIAADLAFDR
jgi:hypothetical protein